jgi:protein ImuA
MPAASPVLDLLRARVRAIEAPDPYRTISFGGRAGEVDRALPWGGLPQGCLHEVTGPAGDPGAPVGFAAALAARLQKHAAADAQKQILWCLRADTAAETGALYAPGLRSFGLDASRVLAVRAESTAQVLWAMEEGLRSGGLAAVIGEVEANSKGVDVSATRRLQLAAEARGVTALLVVPHASAVTGAVTRWHVSSLGGERDGSAGLRTLRASPREPNRTELGPRWQVDLTRCRGGAPASWELEWDHASLDFAVAAGLPDRSAQPRYGATQAAG